MIQASAKEGKEKAAGGATLAMVASPSLGGPFLGAVPRAGSFHGR
jgi:hypothetical protein